MSGRAHPLFKRFALNSTVPLSTGEAPAPYHIYDGHGLLILGTCDPDALGPYLAGEDVHPVLTRAGRGVLMLFLCDFIDASLGAHNELHITALVAPTAGEVVPNAPEAALAAFALRQDWGVLSLHLWNNTASALAYNTEYLGLGAELLQGGLTVEPRRVSFDFRSAEGAPLANGALRREARSDAGVMWCLMRALGPRGLWQVARGRPALAHVINRKCPQLPRNARAQTWTAPDKMVVTAFDPAKDQFETLGGPLSALGFAPQLFEHVTPFRFVYLHPEDPAA